MKKSAVRVCLAGLLIPVSLVHATNTGISFEQDIYAWSGPMAVAEITNDWNGTLKGDDDGLLWWQTTATARYGRWSLSYVYRHHAEYEVSNDLAKGFYYDANDIVLEQPYAVTDRLRARHYEGEGESLAAEFAFEAGGNWVVRPAVTHLRLYRLMWGYASGTLSMQDGENWSGDLYVDYAYTEDKIPPARTLERRAYGDLYSLDLTWQWQYRGYRLDYQGFNLLARMDWADAPVTFGSKNWRYEDGELSNSGDFAVYQREGEVLRIYRPPRFQRLYHTWQLSDGWAVTGLSTFNGIRNGHELGVQRRAGPMVLALASDVRQASARLTLAHRWGRISLLSDEPNVSRSRLLALQAALAITF